jgi:membrane protein YqaA with SNARE-associated domain
MANLGGIDIAIITAAIALISSAIASIMTYIFNRKLKETEQRSIAKLKSLEFENNEKLQKMS